MSPRHWELRVADMIGAIEEIQRVVGARDAAALGADTASFKAVLYNFIVIGEAARSIPNAISDQHPAIDWAGIRAMRNIVTHVYFGVDAARVHDTIQRDLPSTLRALRMMIGTPPSGS